MREVLKNFKHDALKIPNILTIIRLVFSPLPGLLAFAGNYSGALGVFILIALTDKLDGYLARRLDQITQLGQILDPIVDKCLLIITLIFLFIGDKAILLLLLAYFYYFIAISFLYFKTVDETDRDFLPTQIGKANMVIQCVFVGLLIIPLKHSSHLWVILFAIITLSISYYSYFKEYGHIYD